MAFLFGKHQEDSSSFEPQEEVKDSQEDTEPSSAAPKKRAPRKTASKASKKISIEQQESNVAPQETKKPTRKSLFAAEGKLAVDVYQTDGEIVIQAAIAGIQPGMIDVNVENDVVTISGDRENPNATEKKSYFYEECYWGSFSRQIILPEEVDLERAQAAMKDGIFTLRFPKISRKKVRKIKVLS